MLTQEELLQKEKLSLLQHIKSKNCTFDIATCPNLKKDANVSTSLRKQGNVLYLQFQKSVRNLSEKPSTYVNAWIKYTESILYAPNNSEELALGYGNRSAMMFFLTAFENCIVECDRAMSITSNNTLKFKLLCRKAESLCSLSRCAKAVCKEAWTLLNNLNFETKKKNFYEKQLFLFVAASDLPDTIINPDRKSTKSETCEKKNYADTLMNFERSQEVPCASKSVSIRYKKKWGRHIIATEDIPAGSIIAFEEFFSSHIISFSNFTCNNCHLIIRLTNSVPCEYCVFNHYCSESCRKDAWDKYHQFQCPVTPILNVVESMQGTSEGTSEMGLKFILLVVQQVGGLDQMKHQLLEIENTDDPRTKGFSNGIFQDGKLINFFCLEGCKEEFLEEETKLAYMQNSCLCAYLLAKHTHFFGEKMNLSVTDTFLNENILFIAALFLRFYYTGHRNMNELELSDNDTKAVIKHYAAFGGLFNHSCDPNVRMIEEAKIIYMAQYSIKKGTQLFLGYDDYVFNSRDKKSRQKYLQKKYYFTCDCIACRENWSSICLPSFEHVLEIVPSLRTSLPVDKIIKLKKSLFKYLGTTSLKPKVVKKILHVLKLLSKNFTVYCNEYYAFVRCLEIIYSNVLYNEEEFPIATHSFCESVFNA